MGQNNFSGPISPEIGNCQKLQRLDFSGKFFTSVLPSEIAGVTFNISANMIIGRISHGILNCKMLQRLDLTEMAFCSKNSFCWSLVGCHRYLTTLFYIPDTQQLTHKLPSNLVNAFSVQPSWFASYFGMASSSKERMGSLKISYSFSCIHWTLSRVSHKLCYRRDLSGNCYIDNIPNDLRSLSQELLTFQKISSPEEYRQYWEISPI